MVAHADQEALERTIATGEMHYRSRTRGLWHKGATSGNVQRVVALAADCDGDAVLARVTPAGPACHTGAVSCFDEPAAHAPADAPVAHAPAAHAPAAHAPAADPLAALDATIAQRAAAPAPAAGAKPSYTQRLLADRNLRLMKLGEEMAELVTACADADAPRAAEEGADVVYHALVALRAVGVSLEDVRRVLAARAR
jgi:phosphoribosyl-ATP pyrophosphohydrolase/phosphoribosyl-AMP cyclohydrolase